MPASEPASASPAILPAAAARLRELPDLADLVDGDVDYFGRFVRERTIPAGTTFIRQGDRPDGAYALLSGTAQVVRKLPGGGEVALADLAPGAIVGEIGLVARDDMRTATVRATTDLHALFLDRRGFRAGCERGDGPALAMMRRINAIIAARLRALLDRNRAFVAVGRGVPTDARDRLTARPAAEAGFDLAGFLPLLPALRFFDDDARARLIARMTPVRLERGDAVCDENAAPEGLALVVRGAVEGLWQDGDARHGAALFGPGTLIGLPALVDGAAMPMALRAREATLALRLPRADFDVLYHAAEADAVACGLLDAVADSLADSTRHAGNQLVRLVGLARIRALAGPAAVAV